MSGYEPAQYVQEEQKRNKPAPIVSSLYMVTHLIIPKYKLITT